MALYHKIAEFIMEKIKTEEWKKGQLIPSEKEFCELFQVSRPTVRAASWSEPRPWQRPVPTPG